MRTPKVQSNKEKKERPVTRGASGSSLHDRSAGAIVWFGIATTGRLVLSYFRYTISGSETPSWSVPLTRAMNTLGSRGDIVRTTVTKHMTALNAVLQNPAALTLELDPKLSITLGKRPALDDLDNQI